MSDKDIYGKDPYKPKLWQRFKNWINCKRGKHWLPIYISTGVYECSYCDYEQIESGERELPTDLIDELLKAVDNSGSTIIWGGHSDKEDYS